MARYRVKLRPQYSVSASYTTTLPSTQDIKAESFNWESNYVDFYKRRNGVSKRVASFNANDVISIVKLGKGE